MPRRHPWYSPAPPLLLSSTWLGGPENNAFFKDHIYKEPQISLYLCLGWYIIIHYNHQDHNHKSSMIMSTLLRVFYESAWSVTNMVSWLVLWKLVGRWTRWGNFCDAYNPDGRDMGYSNVQVNQIINRTEGNLGQASTSHQLFFENFTCPECFPWLQILNSQGPGLIQPPTGDNDIGNWIFMMSFSFV